MNETRWTTSAVPRRDIREFWLEAVSQAINDVDIRIENSDTFQASLRQRKLGPLTLSHIDVHGTQIVRRTRSLIARSDNALFSVIHLMAGQGWLRQRGREVAFREDECVIVDNREPYEIAIVGRGESLSIHMSAGWLAHRVHDVRQSVAVPFSRTQPWAARLMDLMGAVHSVDADEVSGDLFSQHFGTTLALATGGISETSVPDSRNSFNALQLTLADLASAPNLRVEEVAIAHQISTRHVHHVYAAQDTTFRNELMRLRLKRAHAMLADERFRAVSVEEIARRCGFSDTRHFRRRFREHFETTPAALRQ
jgi:AraC family transcriptional regulator, positive regulator of tynA and feaB